MGSAQDLMQTPRRPMRTIRRTLRLIPSQPRMQCLPGHANFVGNLRHTQTIGNHRQRGLIPLFGHAQLPHLGSAKDQPNPLSGITRNQTVELQPTSCTSVGRVGLEPTTDGL